MCKKWKRTVEMKFTETVECFDDEIPSGNGLLNNLDFYLKGQNFPNNSVVNAFAGFTAREDITYAAGKIDTGFDIPGVTGYLSAAAVDQTSFAGPFSISIWISQNNPAIQPAQIIDKSGEFTIDLDSAGRLTFNYNNVNLGTNYENIDSDWHHIVATYDGIRLRSYVDTIEYDSVLVSPIGVNVGELYIGALNGLTSIYDGKFDEIAKYTNRCLSLADIILIWNEGNCLPFESYT